jgi:putative glutamine amidotransferase
VGEGLRVTARTDDGLVQAVETAGDDYLVAVQWHPEENSEDRRLFLGLVTAAAAHRVARASAQHQGVPA